MYSISSDKTALIIIDSACSQHTESHKIVDYP